MVEQWDLSEVHKNTNILQKQSKTNTKIPNINSAGLHVGKNICQFLLLVFNGSQNIKTRRGGESKTLWSKWPPSGGLL